MPNPNDLPADSAVSQLTIDLCRELYDRFAMGGWMPQDAHEQTEAMIRQRFDTPAAAAGPRQCDTCGEPAASFIPRWGMSFACALPKGHTGEHKQGGNCFKHGEYIGAKCPKWPDCLAAVPQEAAPPPRQQARLAELEDLVEETMASPEEFEEFATLKGWRGTCDQQFSHDGSVPHRKQGNCDNWRSVVPSATAPDSAMRVAREVLEFLKGIDWSTSSEHWKHERIAERIREAGSGSWKMR